MEFSILRAGFGSLRERMNERQAEIAEEQLATAPVVRAVQSTGDGVVARVRALPVGVVARELGAGRRSKGDEIDHSVGVVLLKKRGDTVSRGEAIAELHARDEASADTAEGRLRAAFELGDEQPARSGVVLDIIG